MPKLSSGLLPQVRHRRTQHDRPIFAVVAKLVVVDQVFVAERDADDPLTDQGRHIALDKGRVAGVLEARRKPTGQADHLVGRAEQQRPGFPLVRKTAGSVIAAKTERRQFPRLEGRPSGALRHQSRPLGRGAGPGRLGVLVEQLGQLLHHRAA